MPEDKTDQQAATESQRREAFGELAGRFEAAAFRWAYTILGDKSLAQDAVQEAYIIAFLHMDQLREKEAFPAWFKQIVFTACSRLIRRRNILAKLREQAVEEKYADPSEVVEEDEDRDSIRRALEALPERERVAAEMFYFSDYSQEEIARVLAVPVTTVKKRLQYARERLRKTLDAERTPPSMVLQPGSCPGFLEQQTPDDTALTAAWLVSLSTGNEPLYQASKPGLILELEKDIVIYICQA